MASRSRCSLPGALLIVLAGVLAQYTAATALQRGGAIETIGLMGLVANAAQIAGGIVVFGDPLSSSPLGLSLQVTAFGLVCASALADPLAGRRRGAAARRG